MLTCRARTTRSAAGTRDGPGASGRGLDTATTSSEAAGQCPRLGFRVGSEAAGAGAVAAARPRHRRDQAGSGTAIGVAIIFPILMLVIVSLQALIDTSRIEQSIQTVAHRAARTASLCCHSTDDAAEAARASLAAARDANARNRILCNNDFAGDAIVMFLDVDGNEVPVAADGVVPSGGTVYVLVECRLPPQWLGGYGLPGLDVERQAWGVASVDPYRSRIGV